MYEVKEMTDKEKVNMYMKLPKKELAEMLAHRDHNNEVAEMLGLELQPKVKYKNPESKMIEMP